MLTLGDGDPAGAKQLEFGFKKISEMKLKDEEGNFIDGENERIRQYERYRPQIEALARQIKEKKPAYDLRPLFNIIKKSPLADVAEALNINDPSREVTRNTALRAEFAKFRRALQPKRKTAGQMHYEHYTTLQQAFDLLFDETEWRELTDNYTNYDKVRLIWRQAIGYLQLKGLPGVDRFALARAFNNDERTTQFKYDENGSFPDCAVVDGDSDLSGLGFDEAIYGLARCCGCCVGSAWGAGLENTCRAKMSDLQNLCLTSHSRSVRPGV